MKKTLFFVFALAFSSCVSTDVEEEVIAPNQLPPKVAISKDSSKKAIDTLKTITVNDSTLSKPVNRVYQAKNKEMIGRILSQKRAYVMEKDGKPMEFYGDWFFDVYDVDKTPDCVLKAYDALIDDFIEKQSKKDNFDYGAIMSNSNKIFK